MSPRLSGAAAVAAALILIFTTASTAAETLRVGKAGREAFSFVPADVGQRTGIFKKHGLDIEISSFGGDARIQQAMAADGIDVALGSGPGLAFIVKGSPVKGIAAGQIALTRIPCGAASTATALVIWCTAPLVAPYTAPPQPTSPATEPVLTIAPPVPCSLKRRTACLQP